MTIAPKKILLVHNNPEERGQLGIMLSRFGHEVRFGQSGFDFLKRISSDQYKKVIYLSSRLWLESSLDLQKLNIYEWITKPVDPLKLAVVVCDYFVEVADEHTLPVQKF